MEKTILIFLAGREITEIQPKLRHFAQWVRHFAQLVLQKCNIHHKIEEVQQAAESLILMQGRS